MQENDITSITGVKVQMSNIIEEFKTPTVVEPLSESRSLLSGL